MRKLNFGETTAKRVNRCMHAIHELFVIKKTSQLLQSIKKKRLQYLLYKSYDSLFIIQIYTYSITIIQQYFME